MLKYAAIIGTAVVFMGFLSGVSVFSQERFADNGDGTVSDHLMGLMWSKTDNQGDIDWNDAQKWVKFTFPFQLSTVYENWRLPTLEELKSLVIQQKENKGYETDCGQWVKITPEIRLTCGWVWTADTDAIAPTAWVFNFANVYHYTVRKAHKRAYRALPVRTLE